MRPLKRLAEGGLMAREPATLRRGGPGDGTVPIPLKRVVACGILGRGVRRSHNSAPMTIRAAA